MKFTSFIKRLFIFNAVIFILNKYIKKKNCDFSFFIHSLKIKSIKNTNINNEEGKTSETSRRNTSGHDETTFFSVDHEDHNVAGSDEESSYIYSSDIDSSDIERSDIDSSDIDSSDIDSSDVDSSDVDSRNDDSADNDNAYDNSAYDNSSTSYNEKITKTSYLKRTNTNPFSDERKNLKGKIGIKEPSKEEKKHNEKIKKKKKIPIIYTSIEDIKRFSYIKGKLKLVYVKSFYNDNQKELYEAKFQFYNNKIIYVATFAVIRNSLKDNINQTEKWFNAHMKVLQKNNYNITVRCDEGVEKYYGTISFNTDELQQFKILRKSLKNKLNLTYDNFFNNLKSFYSSKKKYLEYINFKFINPYVSNTFNIKKNYSEISKQKASDEFLKNLISFDKIKYVSQRMERGYSVLCDLEKNFKKVEDRFIMYNLLRDNIIESEESQEVIIFETEDKDIFTYDSIYSRDIQIMSNNFEMEILMNENGIVNENDIYFYLNKYNPVHLELQNKGIIKYAFIYTWLSKYFTNSNKYKNFYPHFYLAKYRNNSEVGIHNINFYSPQHYSFIEKNDKRYNNSTNENKNSTWSKFYNVHEKQSKLKEKNKSKYNKASDHYFGSHISNETLCKYNMACRKIKDEGNVIYTKNSSALSFVELKAKSKSDDKNMGESYRKVAPGSANSEQQGGGGSNSNANVNDTNKNSDITESGVNDSNNDRINNSNVNTSSNSTVNTIREERDKNEHIINETRKTDIFKDKYDINIDLTKESKERDIKRHNSPVNNTKVQSTSNIKGIQKNENKDKDNTENETNNSNSNSSYISGVLGYMKKVKDIFSNDTKSIPLSTSAMITADSVANVMANVLASSKLLQDRNTEKNSTFDKDSSNKKNVSDKELTNKGKLSVKEKSLSNENPSLAEKISQEQVKLEQEKKENEQTITDQIAPSIQKIYDEKASSEKISATDKELENEQNDVFEEKERIDKPYSTDIEYPLDQIKKESEEESNTNEQPLSEENVKSDEQSQTHEYFNDDDIISLEKKLFPDKSFEYEDESLNDQKSEPYGTNNYNENSLHQQVHNYGQDYPQDVTSLLKGSKQSARKFFGLSNYNINKYMNQHNINENLNDKFFEKQDDLTIYQNILDKHPNRMIVGLLEKEAEDMFILNWLYGNDILCVIRSSDYNELFYNMINRDYLKILNVFKLRNDNQMSVISKDSKGILINANFHPHYSALKFFFNDKYNNNVFEEELKSYLLLVHYLLNSNISPCKNYKNVKYFYNEDTFNISNLHFINNKLFLLVSECALEILHWNIPTGIIRKNENYTNTSIFSRVIKYVSKNIHHFGFKLRILNEEDAVHFVMNNRDIMDNDYDVKYDFFLKVASKLYYLQSLGLIHRNIKADNYFVQKKQAHSKYIDILLGDFNYIIEESSYGTFRGSSIYSSPEKLDSYFNRTIYNLKSDVFSLGLSLSTIFLKRNFFFKNIERKLKFPVGKYTVSILKRNPMVLLWIKAVNPFIKKRFNIFKYRSYLKVSVHELEKRLSKKYIYEWFEGKCESIGYKEESYLQSLFMKTHDRTMNRWSSDIISSKGEDQNNFDTCFFKYTMNASAEKTSFSNSSEGSHNFYDNLKKDDDKGKTMSKFLYQFPTYERKINTISVKHESTDEDFYRRTKDTTAESVDKSDKLDKTENEYDFTNASNINLKNYSRRKKKKKIPKAYISEESNVNKIPYGDKLENTIDYSSLDEYNMKKYMYACYTFKNGIVGTIMKIFSIEFEAYRPEIFDIYLLLKKELTYLEDKDDNIKNTLSILRNISEPDINTILRERLFDRYYNIKKNIILKALLFYGYFSIYEHLSYEFKLYELENFPLKEMNNDTFETIINRCMERVNFSEFSNLLLVQHIYNNYQKEKIYSNIYINLYTVEDSIYNIDTDKITSFISNNNKNRFIDIDFKGKYNFLLYMRKEAMESRAYHTNLNELKTPPLNVDYRSIRLATNEYNIPFINSFIIRIDNFAIKDIDINLAVLLNNIFWSLKGKCKCINYTHIQEEFEKNDLLSEDKIRITQIDLHKPIGTVLKELINEESELSVNENKQFNVLSFKPMNIQLDIVLRNSLHLIDRKTVISCARKLNKKAEIYIPSISSIRKNETVKIKIDLGSSKFFYLSFNISLLRSQEILVKDIVYFLYRNYKSELDRTIAYSSIRRNKNRSKFNCLLMNEYNTFFYNNLTGNLIKETSFNKVISLLYNIELMEPNYVIKASMNYYNNRGRDNGLLRLVTIHNVIYEKRGVDSNEAEYFLELSNGVYSEESNQNIDSDKLKLSKQDCLRVRKEKNMIRVNDEESSYHYGTVECLHFLNKKVIPFFNDYNTTNVFDQIVIPSSFIFINKDKKGKNGNFIHSTKTVNFNIVSNIMNLQKYQKEMYTSSDFLYSILQWFLLDKPYDKNDRCNFITHKSNTSIYDMVLSITTAKETKHILYKNNEDVIKFLFYIILKDHDINQYTSEFIMSAIKMHNLKISFVLKNESNYIFPDIQNLDSQFNESSNVRVINCLKQLNGKNVTLLGDGFDEELYIPLSVNFLNKNIIYRISKDTFNKMIYNFTSHEITMKYSKELFKCILSPLTEIEIKFRYLFLSDLSYYVDIPNKLKKNNKSFLVTMNPTFYENLNEKCNFHGNNCSSAVEEIISYINSTFMEPVFVVKNVIS
ncbi:hypothetical protein PMALA_029690 [Plasmodium malariae]|uniref:Protein kinase domain-containing protein n=1 Tax=Plasmodium malariae TaxID=5858 RepID=A0A1A8WEE6_PLAMA|nr:hypothetical protein PMALA_029690 [Plasmodium malariae]